LPHPTHEEIPRVIGLSLDEALAKLFPDADAAQREDIVRIYKELFVSMRNSPDYEEPLFPGTHEILEALDDAGILLGIATGKARRGVDYVLNRHGLTGRFVTIQTPDIAPGKPHPGMILQAMAATGAAPDQCVMVGDTVYDIAMARAADAGAVGVSWGNHPVEELRQAGAHSLIDHLSDLLHAVETITAPKGSFSARGKIETLS